MVRRQLVLLIAALPSASAFAQQGSSGFMGTWAGDVSGVGPARLVIVQVRPDGQLEGRMEFELNSHVSTFGSKFNATTNTTYGVATGNAVRIESALGGIYELALQGSELAGVYVRGTTYRVPVSFKRL
jgi:hypothetical protein